MSEKAAAEVDGMISSAICIPDTSLIIASRNRPRLLAETVASILDGVAVPQELVIVDQSDAPNLALVSHAPVGGCEVRYLMRSRDVGLSRANNTGIVAAKYDLLVFTHDDVHVDPAWFRTLIDKLLTAGSETIVTGRVLPSRAEVAGGFVPTLKTDYQPAVFIGRMDRDELYPLNMAMYRRVLQRVGNFDERLGPGTRYPAAEDNDLGFRLLDAGYRIDYVPEAIVYHRAWRSDVLRLRWSYGRGQGAYFAKHMSLRDGFMLRRLRAYLARQLRNFARHAGHNNRQAVGHLVTIVAVLSAVGQWLLTESRAAVQADPPARSRPTRQM